MNTKEALEMRYQSGITTERMRWLKRVWELKKKIELLLEQNSGTKVDAVCTRTGIYLVENEIDEVFWVEE